jgi:hypothetical protein
MNIFLGILALFLAAIVIVFLLVVFACLVAASVSDKHLEEWESQFYLDKDDKGD